MHEHEQVVTLRQYPICIDTAHGVIKIHRIDTTPAKGEKSTEHANRKLRIVLPMSLYARTREEHVDQRSGWLVVRGDEVIPKNRVLVSVVDQEGHLVELRPATPVRVAAQPRS